MKFAIIVLIVLQKYTLLSLAAPPSEPCPPDSLLINGECQCDPSACTRPPCQWELKLKLNDSDPVPGACCPSYECIGCDEAEMLKGKCPCSPGAVLTDDRSGSQCKCVDRHKKIVNGECVCDPLSCELPQLCNRKSVPVEVVEGCCKKTICKQCPSDSESTNYETDILQDLCVCLPCKTDCGVNETVVIKKQGSAIPGNCCDLYECQKIEENKGCVVGEALYDNGAEWHTPDMQLCRCVNGLSLCSKQTDESQSCYMDGKLYNHSEKWIKEDGCTECFCRNGEEHCISHFCEIKESHITKDDCIKDGRIYHNSESWTEKDRCTKCTCLNGTENCTNELCYQSNKIHECQPLANCNKTCINGFKINKKGCEICKCNYDRIKPDILSKYNISMNELIQILDDYKRKQVSTTTTTTSSTTSTMEIPNIIDVLQTVGPSVVVNNAKLEFSTTTSTTFIVPTENQPELWIYILVALIAGFTVAIIIIIGCVYKSKRKSSIDLTHCHYETVNGLDNNNTIKKTDQLL